MSAALRTSSSSSTVKSIPPTWDGDSTVADTTTESSSPMESISSAATSEENLWSISEKSTPSLTTTVSNCEKGLFTISLRMLSGVKLIFSLPPMTMRSPVFTSMLSRSFTVITLKVPSHLIFRSLSVSKDVLATSNICLMNASASACFNPLFSARACASMEILDLLLIVYSSIL